MNNNELYHYGVPGMRWGQRRATTKVDKTSSKTKRKSETKTEKPKKKLSKGAKIAIGSAVTAATLVGVGKLLTSDVVREKYLLLNAGKALAENLL